MDLNTELNSDIMVDEYANTDVSIIGITLLLIQISLPLRIYLLKITI